MTKHDDAEALSATAQIPGMEGYRAYLALGGTRNFNGWEVRRRRIGADSVQPMQIDSTSDAYVGLSIGYFDIETTFSTQPIMLYGAIADAFGNVRQFRKGDDITDDSALVAAYAKALSEYDILVSWNGKLFDVPVLQGRLAFHRLPPLQLQMHIDLMYYATGQFARIGRKSLQSVSEYFEVENKKTPLRVRQWDGAMSGKPEEYAKIVEHCDADVLVLRDVFPVLKRFVRTIHRAG
jgi:uncharacterized protein YprB with RNaseH-like and TPR domain